MQELKDEVKETKEDLVDAIARWIKNHHNNCGMLHKLKWYRVSIEINGVIFAALLTAYSSGCLWRSSKYQLHSSLEELFLNTDHQQAIKNHASRTGMAVNELMCKVSMGTKWSRSFSNSFLISKLTGIRHRYRIV
jgi:hypothetical protein